ncbi:rRNA (guanine-N1)-methyltransferase [Shewanella inventionis]|uniref:Type IV pili system adhesin PilY n=1 Tax=Shewanella inventionis TaxID=1738770 RepID=A0ABQ1J7V7_9GAMM|nr:PilC/PilY family type IV pilus protein [Shewanella inventionis]MCL1157916.1 rRNA (guanine-N1)-methyltransferase [Shewanella inventionis]UAL42686.1 rRNA (guanine-N1)-methyltransferase [Shewanella inventionis]GGB60154.1 type IV pili system adhesin PilY [Shewanella inventionis]
MFLKQLLSTLLFAILAYSSISLADDTELYVLESTARTGSKPQVLIIFDTSGSMSSTFKTDEPYERGNENTSKGTLKGDTKLYFTRSSSNIPEVSSSQFFLHSVNGCDVGEKYLEDYGMFTGYIREHKYVGENGVWSELPLTDGSSIKQVDCYEDIAERNYYNNGTNFWGFPVDGLGSSADPIRYVAANNSSSTAEIDAAIEKAKLTNFGIGQPITLYTEKYVSWYHSTKSQKNYSRLSVAQRVIEDTIVTTPGVDFGLSVFNTNSGSSNSGGRIVYGITTNNEANKSNLLSTIGSFNADGWTPLCENLYEAYLYFSGQGVRYGDDEPTRTPYRDTSVEVSSVYKSPFVGKQCQDKAYVIYITDGLPTNDNNANNEIKNLPGITSAYSGNYLPALAGWLNNNDVNTSLDGTQTVSTYTIGFGSDAASVAGILKETASRGGGATYTASDAQKLQEALQSIFSNILETNSSFTSPSIASNNFDRTQTLDSVYYAMFLPNEGPRWVGNLKKFKVTGSGDIVDKNGNDAIGDDGNLASSACSYWTDDSVCSATSGGGDGNNVQIGGALTKLQSTSSRTLYGNFGTGGALKAFNKSNAATSLGSEAALATFMGVDKTELTKLFDWTIGIDVDDEDDDGSTTDKRADIMGDPLHSKPLAINYGTEGSPDVRILLGTNAGFLHMFKDSGANVEESWAFMPQELLPNLRELRANVPTGVHSVYGMDSPPVAYVKRNASGTIDKAWLFVGMRRGGKSYYALDITNPDSPQFKWKVDPSSTGMSDMGQSWSEPVVTLIPGVPAGNTSADSASPVVIIGGGYNPSTKDGSGVGTDDTTGRSVYILNADTGALVYRFGTGASGTQLPGIVDSIPNSVAILDSNNDNLTDRLYATDTGANIWRMDLPSASPTSSTSPWTAFKFASLGGSTQATDRRFFAEAAVAQTVFTNISQVTVTDASKNTTTSLTYQNIPYDAVTVGTGHRPHPLDTTRSDMFFMLQDRNVVTKSFTGATGKEIPAALELTDLYDVTSVAPTTEAQNIAFGSKRGWYYSFASKGEKSLSASTIIQGKVYFTSYVPGDNTSANQCLAVGQGRLYGFDLHKGTRTYTQEYLEMGARVPDTPQLVIPPNGTSESYMYLIGIGSAGDDMEKVDDDESDGCAAGDDKCIGGGLGVNKIYYHIDE